MTSCGMQESLELLGGPRLPSGSASRFQQRRPDDQRDVARHKASSDGFVVRAADDEVNFEHRLVPERRTVLARREELLVKRLDLWGLEPSELHLAEGGKRVTLDVALVARVGRLRELKLLRP